MGKEDLSILTVVRSEVFGSKDLYFKQLPRIQKNIIKKTFSKDLEK